MKIYMKTTKGKTVVRYGTVKLAFAVFAEAFDFIDALLEAWDNGGMKINNAPNRLETGR